MMEREAIEQFRDVCAVDETVARRFLEHAQWDTQVAIQTYFQTGGVLPDPPQLRQRHHSTSPPSPPRRTVAPRAPISWFDWLLTLIATPLRITIECLLSFFDWLYPLAGTRPRAVTDGRGDVRESISSFERAIQANGGSQVPQLRFQTATYDELLREIRSSLQYLLVFIHDPSQNDSVLLLTQALNSLDMGELIESTGLLVWGVTRVTAEGQNVAARLRVRRFPYVGLHCVDGSRVSVTFSYSGALSAQTLRAHVGRAIELHLPVLEQARLQRIQRDEDARLREEQEREYARSLLADKAKAEKQKKLEEERREAERKELEEKRKAEELQERWLKKKAEVAASIGNVALSGETIRVAVRFADGTNATREFDVDESLERLFEWVFSLPACPFDFRLQAGYPSRTLHCSPLWWSELVSRQIDDVPNARSFRDEGFERSLLVTVHDNDA